MKKRMMRGTVFAIIAGAVMTAFATDYTWTGGGSGWADKDNWGGTLAPDTGDKAIIPSGFTAEVADSDVATVAALGDLEIQSGGKVSFVNTGTALDLSANLSGAGTITSTNAATITLSGENENFTGPTTFVTTPVTVTSRHGLGGASRTVVHQYARLLFKGNGLTNDVPLGLYGSRKGSDLLLTENRKDPFVQNGAVTHYDGSYISYGNYTFNDGWYNKNNVLYVDVSGGVVVSFLNKPWDVTHINTFDISCPGETSLLEGGNRIVLGAAGNTWSSFVFYGGGSIVCTAEGALHDIREMRLGNNGSHYGKIDLGGYNQTVSYLAHAFNWTPAKTDTFECTVTSGTPATLTMSLNVGTEANWWSAIRFRGQVGMRLTGDGKYTFKYRVSDTTGTLYADAGTVAFEDGAGWCGDVEASGGAAVVLGAGASLDPDGKSEVTLSGSAKLVLSNGVNVTCRKFTVGGEVLAVGNYSAATLPGRLEGEGSVIVPPDYSEGGRFVWTGAAGDGLVKTDGNWEGGNAPDLLGSDTLVFNDDAHGNHATLPAGSPVVYGLEFACAADFSLSAPNGTTLNLGPGGVKTSNGTEEGISVTYALNVPVSVYFPQNGVWFLADGTVLELPRALSGGSSTDSFAIDGTGAKLVFGGDNASLGAQLCISQAAVRVTSPRGLGGTARYTTFICTGTPDLKFTGLGLTNETPFALNAYFNTADQMLTENFDDPLVMKGAFKLAVPSGNVANFYIGSNYRFEGGVATDGCNVYFTGKGGAYSSATVTGKPLDMQGVANYVVFTDGTWHFDVAGTTYKQINIGGKIVCGAAEVLKSNAGLGYFSLGLPGHWGGGCLDLNGYDQTLTTIFNNSASPTKGSTEYGTVTSETAAVLKNSRSDGSGAQTAMPYVFSGLAGFEQAGTRTNVFVNALSDTAGTLKVTNGGLVLKWGAGWTNVSEVVVSGGTLYVNADSADMAFGPARGRSSASLSISGAGRLALEEGGLSAVQNFFVDGTKRDTGFYGSKECTDGRVPAVHKIAQIAGGGVLYVRNRGTILSFK